MLLVQRRLYTTTRVSLNSIKPGISEKFLNREDRSRDGVTFKKNYPVVKRQKAWEKAGQSKDEFFGKNYAHIHREMKARDKSGRYGGHEKRVEMRRQARSASKSKVRREPKPTSRFAAGPSLGYERIFGYSCVLSVLRSGKRKVRTLYIQDTKSVKANEFDSSKYEEIRTLAEEMNIKVEEVENKNEMSILSDHNVHNGFVLEAEPLKIREIKYLSAAEADQESFDVEEFYEDEDTLSVVSEIKAILQNYTNPFGLFLDGITDPRNVGAILRSAYFFGVDFVIISANNKSPLSPVVSKSSSGALEFIEVFKTQNSIRFFEKSKENGWTILTSDILTPDKKKKGTSKIIDFKDVNTVLSQSPCILVLGSEGEGVRKSLSDRSDFLVEIPKNPNVSPLVDSLNVSVASALLIQKMIELQ